MDRSQPRPRVRVVGCGRSYRRDDQVGLLVAEAVACQAEGPLPQTQVSTTEAPGTDLIEDLAGVELLIIVDAAREKEGFPAGAHTRIEWSPEPRAGRGTAKLAAQDAVVDLRTTTHTLSVATALELGHQLDVLPPYVWLYAVAANDFGYGEGLSTAVQESVAAVAWRIRVDIGEWLLRGEPNRA